MTQRVVGRGLNSGESGVFEAGAGRGWVVNPAARAGR